MKRTTRWFDYSRHREPRRWCFAIDFGVGHWFFGIAGFGWRITVQTPFIPIKEIPVSPTDKAFVEQVEWLKRMATRGPV